MDFLARLRLTGGPPHLRREIFRLLHNAGIKHSGSISTAKAVFAIIETQLQENKMHEHEVLLQSLQEILDGNITSRYAVDHLYNSSLSLLKEVGSSNIRFSSALIEAVHDDERGPEVEPVAKEQFSYLELIWDITVVLVSLVMLVVIAEFRGDGYDRYDKPRFMKDPDLIHLPPSTPMRATASEKDKRGQSMYMTDVKTSARFQDILNKFELVILKELDKERDRLPYNLKIGRTVEQQANLRVTSGVRNQTENDAYDVEIASWAEYILQVVDPVYLTSGRQLSVHSSNPSAEIIFSNLFVAAGLFDPKTYSVWLRSPGITSTIEERLRVINILAHELAHAMHKGHDFVADKKGKYVIFYKQEKQTSDTKYLALMQAQPLVDLVLYMGYESDEMTYAEAVLINTAILDMRIKNLYSNAMESDIYKTWREGRPYWTVNHAEFFAEASASFLGFHELSSFPSRDWMAKNDPPLFSLLRQVWPGANLEALPSLEPTLWESHL